MNTNTIPRIPVTYEFRLVVKSPVSADFKFEPIHLDISKINKKDIEKLEEVIFGYVDSGKGSTDNLYMKTKLKFSIRNDNKHYKSFIDGNQKNIGPISFDKIVSVEKAHKRLFFDIVSYVNWLIGSDFHRRTIEWERLDFYYSYDVDGTLGDINSNAPKFSFGDHYYLTSSEKINVTSDDFSLFYQLQINNHALPLHHELLIESIVLSKNKTTTVGEPISSRSAFLILYISLEVATKALMKTHNTNLEWIVNNTQAPPLIDIFKNYIDETKDQVLSEEDLKNIKSITQKRNNIAHNGEEISLDTLNKYLHRVSQWLEKIDRKLGYGWVYDKPYRQKLISAENRPL